MSKKSNSKQKNKTVVTASNPRRLAAYLLDIVILYFILSIFLTLFGATAENPAGIGLLAGAVIITLIYRIGLPLLSSGSEKSGQTPGKRIAGIKIISVNGQSPTIAQLAVRALFYLIVEGFEIMGLIYLLNIVHLMGFPAIQYLTYANVVIAIVSITLLFIRDSHQLLHDYIAKTVVIMVKQA